MASPASTDHKPHQPAASFIFPKRSFGKKQDIKRSFQQSWFARWSWLHYSETDDAAFCFISTKADKAGKLRSGTKDQAFQERIHQLEGWIEMLQLMSVTIQRLNLDLNYYSTDRHCDFS